MLEAIDIVLVCLGAVLSLFAVLAISLLLITKRRKAQGKPYDSTVDAVAPKDYYLEQPSSISAGLKNGATLSPVPTSLTPNLFLRVHGNDGKENTGSKANDIAIFNVDELSEIRDNEEGYRSANSIKRPHRPCKIKLSPYMARAAQAEAVQTEHTLDNFMGDLYRIRNGDDAVLYEEFEILEAWDASRERKCSVAEKARSQNRFVDILPSDETRVILRGSNDYINASLIDGYHNAGQFIATQGPIGPEETGDGRKQSTAVMANELRNSFIRLLDVNDFWRMIWEKNVNCVIMLTDCVESMRQRCTRYWPLLGEVQQFGELKVDLVSESEDPICIHRELDVTNDGERRKVSQYHFLNWRDAKGPESAAHLLDFIERVCHKQYRKPIVVHCSAGVGRTGVLIALWTLLERARQEGVIDIFGTVDTLRRQRSRMVQTPEQYLSLYEAMSLAITEDRI